MKEQRVKPDSQRGKELLSRVLRLYPFDIQINEHKLNEKRSQFIPDILRIFWITGVFDKLDKQGYQIVTPFSSQYVRLNINQYYLFIKAFIFSKIINFLHNIEKKPKDDIYLKNREFISLQLLFRLLFYGLSLKNEEGGWNEAIKNNRNKTSSEFYKIFGFYPFFNEMLSTSKNFQSIINEILKELGFEAFSLSNDGNLRYFGVTIDAEERKRMYEILTSKKFDNVISDLDKIYDHISDKNYSDALANCRKALESFFKRFLLNHGIKKLIDNKDTEDGIVTNLAETLKQNMNLLFKFPSYSKNLDDKGYFHLIESSKYIISGLANPAASHGKSSVPKIKIDEVKVAVSFLILLINTLLPFEK